MPPFVLNHMTVPRLRFDRVLSLARATGCVGVELRNDLAAPLFDGAPPGDAGAAAEAEGMRILALCEVPAFDDLSDAKVEQAGALATIASACGAEAVNLIPRNNGSAEGSAERAAGLRGTLRALKPVFEEHGLTGLIEPLGFVTCSLRDKSQIVDAIEATGSANRFKLVHDTFHHHLAGGGPVFPQHTGMVHVSGVVDPGLDASQMRDEHRILVDDRDRLGSIDQIEALVSGGYCGPISFECFAPEVHAIADPQARLSQSIRFIEARLADLAA